MNKIIKIVFLLILIGIVIILGYGKYKTYRTAYDMSTDEENAVITGSIQSISYAGTEQQWKQIVVAAGNEALTTIPVKYNAKMP